MTRKSPYQSGGRVRIFSEEITLNSQGSGEEVALGTLPDGAVVRAVELLTDTSLGSAKIEVGVSGDADKYLPAQTFTSTDTPTRTVDATNAWTPAEDNEDLILTTSVAALPSSGKLVVAVEYILD